MGFCAWYFTSKIDPLYMKEAFMSHGPLLSLLNTFPQSPWLVLLGPFLFHPFEPLLAP